MAKEIQVRKKRFAAFWMMVLLICSLVLPTMVGAVDENGLVSQGELLAPNTSVRAGTIVYLDTDETKLASLICGSGGWQSVSDYSGELLPGYRFSYWKVTDISSQKSNSGEEYGNVDYPDTVTLMAVVVLEKYEISYDLKGGTGSMVEEYTVETETFTLTEPEKTGNTFLGWTYDGQAEPVKPVSIPKGTTGNRSYTAQWSVNQYTITFVTGGGTEIGDITLDYGSAVTAPADPDRDGYYFTGWDTEIPENMPANNMTITAQWTPYVIDAGTYYLEQGKAYKLGNATKVSGDSSVYSSGSIFYVPSSGNYTFS